ncbi:fatty acid desaturase-domain-containing protein [Zopfochytrium polystomum]|nr:fatty acid desaturase-domain-containing protein [Zopfochytrium polystomum]
MSPPPAATGTATTTAPPPPRSRPTMTKAEIARRISEHGETLIIFNAKVYNLTKWKAFHPGGEIAIAHMNGRDSTDAILAYHPDWVIEKKMPHLCIADLAPADALALQSKLSTSYRQLDAKLRTMGLYNTDYSFYLREAIKFLAIWAAAIYIAVAYREYFFGVLGSAVLCAILWQQGAFVAHDAGHSGITHDNWTDTVLGICLADFMGGLSIGWWKKNHNVHHIVTNHPEHDPDIQHLPFFAVTPRFAENLFSSYYNMTLEFDGVAKTFVPLQHRLFYIILAFGRFNLYVNSWAYLTGMSGSSKVDPKVPNRLLEMSGLVFFATWYGLLLAQLPHWSFVLVHILVAHLLTFLLHVQITLSHFGMDTTVVEDENFAAMALRTTMDVDCPRWLDWLHGGLQFQIEHHLFPRLPRHNLRKARPLVEAFAKEHGLPFHIYTFTKGNLDLLKHLEGVGQVVKRTFAKQA